MKIFYKILSGIFYLAVLLLLLLFLSPRLPLPYSVKFYSVRSGSMEPAIHVGSLVAVTPEKSYQVNDVITFGPDTKTQMPTTHRLVEIKQIGAVTRFVTKGDANDANDLTEIAPGEVRGKVIAVVPFLGYATAAARTPLGLIFLIIVPALYIIIEQIVNIVNETKRLKTEAAKS